jgi:hypothetical protein
VRRLVARVVRESERGDVALVARHTRASVQKLARVQVEREGLLPRIIVRVITNVEEASETEEHGQR